MIPKSKIKIKYTTGDFLQVASSGTPYIGYYIETMDGLYYAGTNNIDLGEILIIKSDNFDKNPEPTNRVRKFNIFQARIKNFLSKTTTIPVIKEYPLERDYERGWFTRYFVRRIDTFAYQEISEDTYYDIIGKNTKYDYNLYESGKIRWYLTKNVYQKNATELKIVERNFKGISNLFPLLNEFFRPDTLSLQQDLYTEGNLLYRANGDEYIGEYHIHPIEGPMVGAFHTEVPHDKLYYLNQLPSPGGISYEEWLQNHQNTINNNLANNNFPSIPIRGDGTETNNSSTSFTNTSYNCISTWVLPGSDYLGITNEQGLIPGGSSCIDPGDGTGLYKYSDYGESVLKQCEKNCALSNLMPNSSVGCLYHFDPNYCSECNIHNDELCAITYTNYQANNTCLCGSIGQQSYYAIACCAPIVSSDNSNTSPSNTCENQCQDYQMLGCYNYSSCIHQCNTSGLPCSSYSGINNGDEDYPID